MPIATDDALPANRRFRGFADVTQPRSQTSDTGRPTPRLEVLQAHDRQGSP